MYDIACEPFKSEWRHPNFKDMTGRRFGRLVVTSLKGKLHKTITIWTCKCDCGNTTDVRGGNLTSGGTSSCGCLGIETRTTHGMSAEPEYLIWRAMWKRCTNPNDKNYATYKDRAPPPEWRDFGAFIGYMGHRPSAKHSIERVDNEKPYGPGNTVWIETKLQWRNMRSNRWIEFKGERLLITEWARKLGIVPASLRQRLEKWPFERAMSATNQWRIRDE